MLTLKETNDKISKTGSIKLNKELMFFETNFNNLLMDGWNIKNLDDYLDYLIILKEYCKYNAVVKIQSSNNYHYTMFYVCKSQHSDECIVGIQLYANKTVYEHILKFKDVKIFYNLFKTIQ